MNGANALPGVQSEPGEASAEDGFVILDGPNGVAVTMTSQAAEETGRTLVAAAEEAIRQSAERDAGSLGADTAARE